MTKPMVAKIGRLRRDPKTGKFVPAERTNTTEIVDSPRYPKMVRGQFNRCCSLSYLYDLDGPNEMEFIQSLEGLKRALIMVRVDPPQNNMISILKKAKASPKAFGLRRVEHLTTYTGYKTDSMQIWFVEK